MTTLADKARGALEDDSGLMGMAYGKEFARAVLAADELAYAVEMSMIDAAKKPDPLDAAFAKQKREADLRKALVAYRKAMEVQS